MIRHKDDNVYSLGNLAARMGGMMTSLTSTWLFSGEKNESTRPPNIPLVSVFDIVVRISADGHRQVEILAGFSTMVHRKIFIGNE